MANSITSYVDAIEKIETAVKLVSEAVAVSTAKPSQKEPAPAQSIESTKILDPTKIRASDDQLADAKPAQLKNVRLPSIVNVNPAAIAAQALASLSYLQDALSGLSQFQDYVQKKKHLELPGIIDRISYSIYDTISANQACVITYTEKWFANSLLSDEDKKLVAACIYNNASKFIVNHLDLYTKIMRNDYATLNRIRYPVGE